MDKYLLYLLITSITAASPGPGTVLSLTNALRFGVKSTIPGILGIASGIFCVALIAATSLGVLITKSATAFTVIKYLGAAYLLYMGINLWRAANKVKLDAKTGTIIKPKRSARFSQGFFTSLSNPKVIVFFMALFPQFVVDTKPYVPQLIVLALTYCLLVCVIHMVYASFAGGLKKWLSESKGQKIINRSASVCFIGFSVALFIAAV